MGAINVVMDQTPSAVVRLLSGKMEISNAWLPGIIGPDTAPWRMRKAISELRLHAIPHRNEANVKRRTDATNLRTTPKPPTNQPVSAPATPKPDERRAGHEPGNTWRSPGSTPQ